MKIDDVDGLLPPDTISDSNYPLSTPTQPDSTPKSNLVNHIAPFNQPFLYELIWLAQSEDKMIWRDKIKLKIFIKKRRL